MGNTNSRRSRTALPEHITNRRYEPSLYHATSVHKNIAKTMPRHSRSCDADNFVIIWLDSTISESNGDIQFSIAQLRKIGNSIKNFTDPEKCVDFMTETSSKKIFFVVSGALGQSLLPRIENMPQIDSIYVFCRHKSQHEPWANKYRKIKGVFTKIERVYDILRQNVPQYECDLIQISIISNTKDLNEVDQPLMYLQSLNEVLLDIEHQDKDKNEFIDFCRQQHVNNHQELAIIDEFEEKYEPSAAIWWYTRECFLYSMLNKAFRTQNIEVIIKMGYFIRDLHHQIEQIHSQSAIPPPFIIYRGQVVSDDEFEKMKKSKGSLLLFNTFLSANTVKDSPRKYARRIRKSPDLKAILFCMKIDVSISSTSFASLDKISYYLDDDGQILFSMHTIFRIGDVEQIEDQLWRIDLTLTSENDRYIAHPTDDVRREIHSETGDHRVAASIISMGQYDRAEEISSLLLNKTFDDDYYEPAILDHQSECINNRTDDLTTKQSHDDCSTRVRRTKLPSTSSRSSTTYSSMEMALGKQGDLQVVLQRFELARHLDIHTLEPSQLKCAFEYNNIGMDLMDQGKYGEALSNYKHALEIFLSHLPPRHPYLATIYNNMGSVYDLMDHKSTALSYYRKTLEIEQKSLPVNHPALAVTHHHIATALSNLHRVEEAVKHARQTVDIARHTFSFNHPQMQIYQDYLEQLILKDSSIQTTML